MATKGIVSSKKGDELLQKNKNISYQISEKQTFSLSEPIWLCFLYFLIIIVLCLWMHVDQTHLQKQTGVETVWEKKQRKSYTCKSSKRLKHLKREI